MHEDLAAWEETRKTLNALLTPRPEQRINTGAAEIPVIRTEEEMKA